MIGFSQGDAFGRTDNLRFTRALLCQLSYIGLKVNIKVNLKVILKKTLKVNLKTNNFS